MLTFAVWTLECNKNYFFNLLYFSLLLIPQSFDWLAAFLLDLLQAILFIAV